MRKTNMKAAAAALAGVALCAGTVAVATNPAYAADTTEDGYEIVIGTPKSISYIGDYEGRTTVDEWEAAVLAGQKEARAAYESVLAKATERTDVDWSDLRGESAELDNAIDAIWTVASAEECSAKIKSFEGKVDEKISKRDEEIAAEEEAARIAEEEAAAAAAAAYYDYGGYSGGGGYDQPSGGLTMQSGVNYYNGQRETYYSSNVLYHYQTSQWSVDNEGFYREGDYYVVAANDGQYSNGDTYEGSKGTCIVRDSGCDYGTTDYYVAW